MTFFESLIALLAVAVSLSQVTRRMIAERLHLSPVLATVAMAMTLATHASVRDSAPYRNVSRTRADYT